MDPEPAQEVTTGVAVRDPASEPAFNVMRLLPYGVALHMALPLVMSWFWASHTLLVGQLWLAVHLLFPVLLVGSYRYWAGQGERVFLLVAINHAVTFITWGVAVSLWSH
jgi:hypothetical protein